MLLERTWSLYLKHQLSAASELSPNIARQMNHVLTFCIVTLVLVNIRQLIYKGKYVKQYRRWRKLPWFLQKSKSPVLLLEMTSAYI